MGDDNRRLSASQPPTSPRAASLTAGRSFYNQNSFTLSKLPCALASSILSLSHIPIKQDGGGHPKNLPSSTEKMLQKQKDTLPGLLPQRDVVPADREQGSEALPGMDAVTVQKQTGVGIGVAGGRKFELTDSLFHGVYPPMSVLCSVV